MNKVVRGENSLPKLYLIIDVMNILRKSTGKHLIITIHMRERERERWEALNKVGTLKIQDSSLNQATIIQGLFNQQQALTQDLKEDFSSQSESKIQGTMHMSQ